MPTSGRKKYQLKVVFVRNQILRMDVTPSVKFVLVLPSVYKHLDRNRQHYLHVKVGSFSFFLVFLVNRTFMKCYVHQ